MTNIYQKVRKSFTQLDWVNFLHLKYQCLFEYFDFVIQNVNYLNSKIVAMTGSVGYTSLLDGVALIFIAFNLSKARPIVV